MSAVEQRTDLDLPDEDDEFAFGLEETLACRELQVQAMRRLADAGLKVRLLFGRRRSS